MESKAKDRIKIRDGKLNALLDLTNAINANLSKNELFEQYKKVITQDLGIAQFALFIKEENWHCTASEGISLQQIAEISNNASSFDDHALSITDWAASGSLDIVLPIQKDEQSIAFIFLGDGEDEQMSISPSVKHMRFVQTLTSILVVAIENKKLQEKSIQQAALQRELELAAEMQNMLLPKVLPLNDQIQVEALYQAHGEVGGDYYDFFYINDHEWVSCMADVSGKGISAAFLMAGFQAHIKALFHQPLTTLSEAVVSLNQNVIDASRGERFVTFFICKFNNKNRILEYINCGHNPALIAIKNQTTWLTATIPGLGMIDELPHVRVESITIPEAFTMISYTDGLVEIENSKKQPFGEERIAVVMKKRPPHSIPQYLLKAAENFKENQPFVDDLAILAIQQQ
jgi:sigma-B regulation protein RsbU (phosphoserine phosphatase)